MSKGKNKHEKKDHIKAFGAGDPFFLVEQDGVTGSYLTGFTTNPKAPTWGVYDDAVWTYYESRANHLIQTENLSANAKPFTGGTQPPSGPPF